MLSITRALEHACTLQQAVFVKSFFVEIVPIKVAKNNKVIAWDISEITFPMKLFLPSRVKAQMKKKITTENFWFMVTYFTICKKKDMIVKFMFQGLFG